jgi:hypothetical protein
MAGREEDKARCREDVWILWLAAALLLMVTAYGVLTYCCCSQNSLYPERRGLLVFGSYSHFRVSPGLHSLQ